MDAIVPWRDFVWIDDDPLLAEVEALRRQRSTRTGLLIVDSDEDLLAVIKAIGETEEVRHLTSW